MISALQSVVVALAVMILAGFFARQYWRSRPHTEDDRDLVRALDEEVSLGLASRIFDPADYHWLRDTIGFPQLAESLLRRRRDLALRWLRALRTSHNELVRSPRLSEATAGADSPGSWAILFLTLRFQLLLAHAQATVYLFGPYHPLVPSLGWLPAFLRVRTGKVEDRIVGVDGVS